MKKLSKILVISSAVVLLPIIVFALLIYVAAFSDWWIKFPEPQRSQIALGKLEMLGSGVACRDDCFGEKIFYRQMILKQLAEKGYDSGVGKLMLEQVTWEYKNNDFREEVVDLIKLNEEAKKEKDPNYQIKIPTLLLDFLNQADGSADVKSKILASFPEDAAASEAFLSNLLALARDKTKSFDERRQAMTSLENIMYEYDGSEENPIPKNKKLDYQAVCDIFLTIAENEKGKAPEELSFRGHTLSSMNGCLFYKEFYTEDFFVRLKDIFYEEEIHPGLQRELLTELYKFKNVDQEKLYDFLIKAVDDEKINKIIRSDIDRVLINSDVNHKTVDLTDEEYDELRDTLDFYIN